MPVATTAPPAPAETPAPPEPAAPPEGFPFRYRVRPGAAALPPLPPDESAIWIPSPFEPDTDLRIQALSGLLQDHPERVIPLLKEIAFDTDNPTDARRAVFVLAQSTRPDAHNTIVDVAKRGPVPVRIAAVRELGRVNTPNVGAELMQVYSTASDNARIKREVVSSLGAHADNAALLRIAKTEADQVVRNTAIVTLGRTGAREQLAALYVQAPRESRAAVLTALLAAKDEDQLIKIAETESDPVLRQQARRQLRMLGTPKALQYLSEHK
jgi:HEAT repeat protein